MILHAIIAFLLVPAQEPLPPAQPAPEWNARFERTEGWIGGDGAYTVAVTPQRTLWLFSDTWIGSIKNGRRTNATIVNNTVAVQEGHGEKAKLEFVVAKGKDGKPAALITPADGRGWFWLFGGVCVEGKLYLFLAQIEKTGDPGVFGFRQIGVWLGIVSNPLDHPTAWRIEQKKLVFTEFSPQRSLSFGAAVLRDGEYVYIYGIDEEGKGLSRSKHLIVARVPATSVGDFSAWRFYKDGEWITDFRASSRLAKAMANEMSVSYVPHRKQYIAVYSEQSLSPRILARTAPTPVGPWSAPTMLFQCPEPSLDKKNFCYAAKAHPELVGEDELLISYVVNSFDFWQVARDARLYWPRFVRVKPR
jgi:hypothetical protein